MEGRTYLIAVRINLQDPPPFAGDLDGLVVGKLR